MKKSTLFLVICVLSILLCSCFLTEVKLEGLDTYSEGNSSYSICQGPMPSDMIDKFPYIDGNHYFYSRSLFVDPYDKMLIYLTYDKETYIEAKDYVFEDANLNDEKIVGEIGTYIFYRKWDNEAYPYWYGLIAFSDTDNTVVFLSIYNSEMEGKTPDEHTLEDQITDHFSEWYSFK